MSSNPIIDEIRATRERLGARFDFDVKAISKDAHERALQGERPVVSCPPRAPVQVCERKKPGTLEPS